MITSSGSNHISVGIQRMAKIQIQKISCCVREILRMLGPGWTIILHPILHHLLEKSAYGQVFWPIRGWEHYECAHVSFDLVFGMTDLCTAYSIIVLHIMQYLVLDMLHVSYPLISRGRLSSEKFVQTWLSFLLYILGSECIYLPPFGHIFAYDTFGL